MAPSRLRCLRVVPLFCHRLRAAATSRWSQLSVEKAGMPAPMAAHACLDGALPVSEQPQLLHGWNASRVLWVPTPVAATQLTRFGVTNVNRVSFVQFRAARSAMRALLEESHLMMKKMTALLAVIGSPV